MKNNKKLLFNIFYWFAILMMAASGIYIGYTYYEFYISEQQIVKVQEIVQIPQDNKESDHPIDFIALQEINADAKAWIRIAGTKIDYPVLHGTNNDYYLNHNIFRKYDRQGSVFLDYEVDIGAKYMTIFAHNMKNGSMFAEIHKYQDERYKERNPLIQFFTSTTKLQFEVVAAFYYDTKIDTENYILRNVDSEAFKSYHSFVESRNVYGPYSISEQDMLLTLSTCNYDKKGDRFVLIARLK